MTPALADAIARWALTSPSVVTETATLILADVVERLHARRDDAFPHSDGAANAIR